MYRVGVAVTILFLLIFSLQGQGPGKTPAYLLLYEKAEQLFVSETAGDITETIPTSLDAAIRCVGAAVTAEDLLFNPSPDNITRIA